MALGYECVSKIGVDRLARFQRWHSHLATCPVSWVHLSDPDTRTLGVTFEVRTVAVAAATTNLPGAPTRVIVTPGTGNLVVKWQPPERERGSLVHRYTVRYKAGGADGYNEITVYSRTGINTCSKENWTEDPGCREVEITALDSSTEYVLQIRTHNAVGFSEWTTIGNTHRPN